MAYNRSGSNYEGLASQPIWLINLLHRLIRRAATSIKRAVRQTQFRSSTNRYLTRVLTCCSRRLRLRNRTPDSSQHRQYLRQEDAADGSETPLNDDYSIFRSPSLSNVIGKFRANSAPKRARRRWRRVQMAAGFNLRTAEEIVAVVEDLKQEEQSSAAQVKRLEGLFVEYLRLNAPDSGVALTFLNAMDVGIR